MAKVCPVNFIKLDENQVRIQASLIALSSILFITNGWIILAVLLMYDFSVKLFISSKFSIYTQIAQLILKPFKLTKNLVDSAPKVFASKIGFGFSVIILFAALLGLDEVATIFAIILAICAGLEALINYCVGCKFYAILHHFNIL